MKRLEKVKLSWLDEMTLLLHTIIFNDPTLNVNRKGQLSFFDLIPDHKTLFLTENRTGLPIGNYTSQFFANVYKTYIDSQYN